MKIAEINIAVSILAGIKINRITDKRVKACLVNDYLHLRKFVKEAEAERQDLVDKFQQDWADELPAVQAFRDKGEPVVGHESYMEAEKDANKAISAVFSAEVDIDLSPVEMDAMMDFSDDITLEQIAFLQEAGIIASREVRSLS